MSVETTPASISMTESAAKRIVDLVSREGNQDTRLRIVVEGGGCSGFQYVFKLDTARDPTDKLIERSGAGVVVDALSLPLVFGLELDWVESLEGAHFAVRNPNATASCSCGNSFAI
ncbi:MAG: iron-sulfur cluster insertion protein ErpA [Alphaproteobacteria bacterium]